MDYKAILSPGAEQDYLKAPDSHKDAIARRLNELLKAPVRLSRPGPTPPYEPGYQVYEFGVADKIGRFEYAILFKYKDDERHLWIWAIGRRLLDYRSP